MDWLTKDYGAPPNLQNGKAANEDEYWSKQMQDEEDAQAAFEPSTTLHRSPVKKNNPYLEPPAEPRKPAAKPTTEENEEPSTPTHSNSRPTEQQHKETSEETEINEVIEVAVKPSHMSSMKTLWKTAIGIIKRTKAKLGTQKTKKEIMAEFDEIVTFMEAVHAIEDEMTNVKHELQDIKKTAENSGKAIKDSEKTTKCNWAAIMVTPKHPPPAPTSGLTSGKLIRKPNKNKPNAVSKTLSSRLLSLLREHPEPHKAKLQLTITWKSRKDCKQQSKRHSAWKRHRHS
jgi:hypothetical protein